MPTLLHSALTGSEATHQFAYKQSTDPGTVGAGKGWIDTSAAAPYQLKVRNASNTAWELVGTTGIADPTTNQGDLIIRGSSSLSRLAIGAGGTIPLSDGTTLSYTASPTLTGEVTAADIKITGLNGASGPCRLVGANISGAPTTGTFTIGDVAIDLAGRIYICTSAGTPGTWVQATAGLTNPMTTNQDIIVGGSSGTPARLGVGSNGQVLGITGGVIGWVASPSGFANPMASTGDMITGGASGTATRLAVGANGQVLTVAAGVPSWANAGTSATLLTSNSNMIQETILTVAAASISIPNIPQNYRDLRIELVARSDAATTNTQILVRVNGDTGANYDGNVVALVSTANQTAPSASVGSTSGVIAWVVGNNGPAGDATSATIDIPSYTGTTWQKAIQSTGALKNSTSATNQDPFVGAAFWRNTAAITSLTLLLASGNFMAGTEVRVYGLPVSAAGAGYGQGARLRNSATQSSASGTALVLGFDTEDQDADNQHFTSNAALTGTVAKTSGSATLTGTSTLFTTQLSVGQVITVPGTANEQAVVIAIASDTSLTAATTFANTATGQTATRLNSPIVFRSAGMYTLDAGVYAAAVSTGNVSLQIRLNGTTIIAQKDGPGINATAAYSLVTERQFQVWDYVEVLWTQSSGGAVVVQTDERTHFASNARPTVVVAVPYVCIQDQKASGTDGGTFTSGAYQVRTLNTVASDIAAISSISANQITLPAGWYRCHIEAPACQVDGHRARLRNVTDSTTVLVGRRAFAGSIASGAQTDSVIEGKFQLTGTKVLQVEHICTTTKTTTGFGVGGTAALSVADIEVYTSVEFWKEG